MLDIADNELKMKQEILKSLFSRFYSMNQKAKINVIPANRNSNFERNLQIHEQNRHEVLIWKNNWVRGVWACEVLYS